MADDSRFDAEQLLDLSKAHVVEGGSIGLDKNRLVTLRWDVSLGAGETCRRWLESNRRTLSDFTAEQKSYEGKWRTLKVTTETGRSKQRENVIVEHTLAYGLITKLVTAGSVDWSESTWALESRILLGNTTDADSEESTDTDVPQKHLYIRFPFIDPRKVHEIAASFSATTYTTPIVDGEEVSGTFHRIAVNIRKEDDGTCSLILYLADPQYTLAAYRDYKTTQHRGVYYLWGVPRDIAQSILDDWKTENDDATDRTGASASASERSDGLVDLVLISEPLFKENLSTDPIPVACDTSIVYHFAWGYSKTELGVFLAAHSGTLGSGLTREVQVNHRSDGTFDATIVERTLTYDEDKHLFTVSTVSGTGITRSKSYGWNLPMSVLETIKAVYESPAEGKTSSFDVRREDDCTFDYVAEIIFTSAIQRDMETAGTGGVQEKVISGRNLHDSDLTALEATLTPAARKRVQMDVQVQQDDTSNVTVKETTVQEVTGESTDDGNGILTVGSVGRNVDLVDLAHIVTSAARKRHSISLSANDDGTFNYAVTEQELKASTESSTSSGSVGVDTTGTVGRNVDAAALVNIITRAARKRHSLSLSANDDGTFNYTVVEQTVEHVEGASTDSGDTGLNDQGIPTTGAIGRNVDLTDLAGIIACAARKRHSLSLSANDDNTFNYAVTEQELREAVAANVDAGNGIVTTASSGRNVDASAIEDLVTSAPRKRHTINISPNDDNTFNYSVTEQELQLVTGEILDTGNGIVTTAQTGRNVDAGDLVGIVVSAARKRHSVSLSANDDGTFNYSVVEQTVEEITHTEMSTGGTGGQWTAVTGRNVDAADLAGNITTTSLSRVSLNLSANDDGTLNYSGSVLTVVATEAEGAISDSGDTGIARDIHIGNNVTPAQFASMVNGLSSTATKDYQVNASADDYGNISYVVRSEEQQAGEGSVAVADDGTHGIAVTAKTGNIVTQADLNTLAASLAAGARKRTQISLTALPAGGFRYSAQQSEAQATTDQFTVGTVSRITTVDIGTNQDEPPIVPVPAIGRVVSVSAQHADDGTINYRIDSSERVGVPTDQSTHGSYAQRVTKDKTEGDNAVPSDAPSIGESHFINFDINDDGTVDWDRTTITRVEMEHSLALSHRIPSVESEGVTDTATVFNGVLVADIPEAAGTYFYFSQFSINDDFTFSGVLHDLTYVATPDTDPFTIAQGSYTAEETQFDQVYGDKRAGKLWLNSLMRVINYEISYTITRSGTAALIAMSGGELRGSSLDRVTINGQSYWRAVRLSLTYVNSWQHIDRVEITTSPTYTP